MADLLSERGIFWWADVRVPKGCFAPEGAITGILTIGEEGEINIALNDVMPSSEGRFSVMRPPPEGRSIAGQLTSDHRYILAEGLRRGASRWSSVGVSTEAFNAETCLISDTRLPRRVKVRSLDFDLAGYEDWLRIGELKTKRTKRSFKVAYRYRAEIRYRDEAGGLTLSRDLASTSHGSFGSRGLDLKEVARLRYKPTDALSLDDALLAHGQIQELLILLTNSEHQMAWPKLGLTNGKRCALYYRRTRSTAAPPQWGDCITSFPELKSQFGEIFFSWLRKREDLGSGAYLYLATRKGMHLYTEHHFISLMWGLEALHRTLKSDPRSAKYEEKLARILADVQLSQDRKWLKSQTKFLTAPRLEERLLELFTTVPADIEEARLKGFCAECAKLRNELSHHGSAAETGAGQHLSIVSRVVSYLYHALLLLEIGIPEEKVRHWLTKGHEAHRIGWFMEQAGLKPNSKAAEGFR